MIFESMALVRIARFESLANASWFLARKARELVEHSQSLTPEMLFVTHGDGGMWILSSHLAKQKLPFRKLENVIGGVAAVCSFSDTYVAAVPKKHCFVLLSASLGDERAEHLCRFLHTNTIEQAYLSICLESLEEAEALSFNLDAELSPVVGSIDCGHVYFRCDGEHWHCDWPDRPTWMVPRLLVNICGFLAAHQRDFLEGGVTRLAPLKMAEVAASIGCHVSSISRVVAGVEAQTDWGRIPLKNFFSGSIPSGPATISQVQLKATILEIIEQEDRHSPLSDQAIAEMVNAQGVSVSRRGITKYRNSLGISSTRERKIVETTDD